MWSRKWGQYLPETHEAIKERQRGGTQKTCYGNQKYNNCKATEVDDDDDDDDDELFL